MDVSRFMLFEAIGDFKAADGVVDAIMDVLSEAPAASVTFTFITFCLGNVAGEVAGAIAGLGLGQSTGNDPGDGSGKHKDGKSHDRTASTASNATSSTAATATTSTSTSTTKRVSAFNKSLSVSS